MTNNKKTTVTSETYNIKRGLVASTQPGRKPSRLGNTIRMLNIGDGFIYPYTSGAATFNVRRAAKAQGIEVSTAKDSKGVFAVRVA